MNKVADSDARAQLLAASCAVPPFAITQSEVEAFGRRFFSRRAAAFERLSGAYANAGIEKRYSCVPIDWYETRHGWKDWNKLYIENALDLIQRAALEAIDSAGLSADQIDGIVTVSTTGIAVPSLDARLMERIPFRRNVQRLPIFGLGCAGGVLGLARTAAMALAQPGTRWLLLVVELCGLTFRGEDLSKSNIIATALFGDGAAAAIVQTGPAGHTVSAWGEHCWRDSLDVMGWRVEEDGLGVQFSRDIPHLVQTDFRVALDGFLWEQGLATVDIDHFLFHPGGAKVLTALEEALGLTSQDLADTRAVLREYGNMSAATVLFVLKRAIDRGHRGRCLLGALGPGFTAGFALITLV